MKFVTPLFASTLTLIFLSVTSFAPVIFTPTIASAQTASPSAAAVAAREAELQAQLNQVLQEIDAQQKILAEEQKKGTSLQRDISILNAQIKEAQLKIRARNLAIQALGKDIDAKNETIKKLDSDISKNQESLGQLVRKTNVMDSFTLADVVLSNKSVADFFSDVDAFNSIKESIQTTLGVIRKNQDETVAAKQTLSKKQLQEIDARISIQEEQAKIAKDEKAKAALLALSKKQQANYQQVINEKQKRANEIRTALFSLRDTAAIPFGDAYNFALEAEKATGVRPAFLLAVLTQESNLGANVGACFLTNTVTGAGARVSTGVAVANVMKPTRDVAPFLEITQALGRDPMQTRISCPLAGGGYGGAMGPAQFIPSTWQLFKARIAKNLGKAAADPWNPRDAFMAAAVYLGDLGAGAGTRVAERNAACRYYSGRACDSKKPANTFYGDQVVAKATSIQVNMIDPLKGF